MTRPLTSAQRQQLRTPANLWRAMLVVLALVGVVLVFTWPQAQRSDGVHVVDTAGPIAAARQQAGFDLLVPVGLGARWRPTSTTFTPAGQGSAASFRIGYVTPDAQYAEFLESNDAPDAVAAQYGPLDTLGGTPVGDTTWSLYRAGNGHRLLRHTTRSVTAIVTGTASTTELTELAASLH